MIGEDKNLWIITKRQKTGSPVKVPLLEKAEEILTKPLCTKSAEVH